MIKAGGKYPYTPSLINVRERIVEKSMKSRVQEAMKDCITFLCEYQNLITFFFVQGNQVNVAKYTGKNYHCLTMSDSDLSESPADGCSDSVQEVHNYKLYMQTVIITHISHIHATVKEYTGEYAEIKPGSFSGNYIGNLYMHYFNS